MRTTTWLLGTAAILGACGQPAPPAPAPAPCQAGAEQQVRDQLYLGRGMRGGAEVPDSSWQRFLKDEVTARFPNGITVLPGNGQWRGDDGVLVEERSWVLVLYHPVSAAADSAVIEIAQGYKRLFRQEAVLRDRTMVCLSL
ncbi:MAG: DUF3574 domain-containing protein [Gemmatimonadota bacterium]